MFDSIINEAKSKFGFEDEGASLLTSLLGLIADPAAGGFAGFVEKFRAAGLGGLVDSWITDGENHPVSNEQLESALGEETIAKIAGQSGVERATALSALAFMIPHVVDALTADGEIPDDAGLRERIRAFGGSAPVVAAGKVADTVEDSGGGVLYWLMPLALLAILVFLGWSYSGKSEPITPPAKPAESNRR
jgi:uncharacterized protein YidB (DUF937 family)